MVADRAAPGLWVFVAASQVTAQRMLEMACDLADGHALVAIAAREEQSIFPIRSRWGYERAIQSLLQVKAVRLMEMIASLRAIADPVGGTHQPEAKGFGVRALQ